MTIRRQFALAIVLAFFGLPAFAHSWALDPTYVSYPAENSVPASAEKTGAIPTKPGQCLHLTADPGNVHVFTDESAQVSYHVALEADSRDSSAEDFLRQFVLTAKSVPDGVSLDSQLPWRKFKGEFGVSFEVHVPHRYCLKINTQGGGIEVQDIDGPVELVTGGGNITVGKVGRDAGAIPSDTATTHPLPNRGAYLAARLETQGGHIAIGDVAGDLRATTSGGHITAGNVEGDAILHTGGGQIQVGRVAGAAALDTGGGNIRVAKAGASVTADTAGGQIDFGEASGVIHARTGGGGLHIDRVSAPADVEMSGGAFFPREIDASLNVSADDGDLIVFLPRELAASIDAVIQRGNGHSIVADSSLPLKISYQDAGPGLHTIRGQGDLNGGGPAMHLKAVAGNIVLNFGERHGHWNGASHAAWAPAAPPAGPEPAAMQPWNPDEEAVGFFEGMRRRILESWWGGVPVDAAEMQKHLEREVAPVYPDVARKAGVEGDVVLRVLVSPDGHVADLHVLDGPPILARVAVEAVQQWQYQAPTLNGRPTNVVSTLIVSFRLK